MVLKNSDAGLCCICPQYHKEEGRTSEKRGQNLRFHARFLMTEAGFGASRTFVKGEKG